MAERKTPMRRCIGCRESFPQKDLIRMTYDGTILQIDRNGKSRGRGVYLCKNADCIEKARKTKAFNRNYKKEINQELTNAVLDEALAFVKEVMNGEESI